MGLLEQIQARQTHLRSLSCVDEQGPTDGPRVPPEFFAGRRGDPAWRPGRRLLPGHKDDTEYIFGDSVTSLEQDDGGVHVTFARAAPRTFGLVVGGDGVHSGIRRLAFGTDERFSRGLGLYTSIFTVPNLRRPGPGRPAVQRGRAGRSACSPPGDPARAIAQLYFTAPDCATTGAGAPSRSRTSSPGSSAASAGRVPRLLAEMPAATDFYLDTASQIRMDSWSNGAGGGDRRRRVRRRPRRQRNRHRGRRRLRPGRRTRRRPAVTTGPRFARYEQRLRGYVAGGQKQASGSQSFLAPATWKKIPPAQPVLPTAPLPARQRPDQPGRHQDRHRDHAPQLRAGPGLTQVGLVP